jgi:hypothetical protein
MQLVLCQRKGVETCAVVAIVYMYTKKNDKPIYAVLNVCRLFYS